jgi:acetylglutamate kinase
MRLVIKIGGNEIDSEEFLSGVSAIIRDLIKAKHQIVIVHGAGKEISAMHERLNVPYETINGLRRTSAEGMKIVEMVLRGMVNTRIVRCLVNDGVQALGLSGVDLGLLRSEPVDPALGLVGHIAEVKSGLIEGFLMREMLPVLAAPVSLGLHGESLNVNADEAAAAIAAALAADYLVMVSNVPGVLQGEEIIEELDSARAKSLIETGVISGGMIPKVQSALMAAKRGVKKTLICNLPGLVNQMGTVVVK